MSKFLEEMANEAAVRIQGYRRELEQLQQAAARITELNGLISEAEAELSSFLGRVDSKSVTYDRLQAVLSPEPAVDVDTVTISR